MIVKQILANLTRVIVSNKILGTFLNTPLYEMDRKSRETAEVNYIPPIRPNRCFQKISSNS